VSNIEWTDETWNPVVGCTPVSSGCLNCYAAAMAHRLGGMGQERYVGLTTPKQRATSDESRGGGTRRVFNGAVRLVEEALTRPLSWRKPRKVFVCSMSDLFHEGVPDRFIRLVFAAMSYAGQHTFQVLTKRPERMAAWFADEENSLSACQAEWLVAQLDDRTPSGKHRIGRRGSTGSINGTRRGLGDGNYWPLPNVWLGTSVEDQAAADKRIPHLLRCPAAVRFLSVEPLLGAVELSPLPFQPLYYCSECGNEKAADRCDPCGTFDNTCSNFRRFINWVIVGGESGANARPCDVAWVRAVVGQCRAAGVPCFVKQLGARPYDSNGEAFCAFESHRQWIDKAGSWLGGVSGGGHRHKPRESVVCVDSKGRRCAIGGDFMRADADGAYPVRAFRFIGLMDAKGGEMGEWPEDLRVREWPLSLKTGSGQVGNLPHAGAGGGA
jgi:protein gp37